MDLLIFSIALIFIAAFVYFLISRYYDGEQKIALGIGVFIFLAIIGYIKLFIFSEQNPFYYLIYILAGLILASLIYYNTKKSLI